MLLSLVSARREIVGVPAAGGGAQPHLAQLVLSDGHLARRPDAPLRRAEHHAARHLPPSARRVGGGGQARGRIFLRSLAGRALRADRSEGGRHAAGTPSDGRRGAEAARAEQRDDAGGGALSGRPPHPGGGQRAGARDPPLRPGPAGRETAGDHAGGREHGAHDQPDFAGRQARRGLRAGRASSRCIPPSPASLARCRAWPPRTFRCAGRPTDAPSTSFASRRPPGKIDARSTSRRAAAPRGRSSGRRIPPASCRSAPS